MTGQIDQAGVREAVAADAARLLDLEQRTNTVALAHVFAPTRHAFPAGEVLLRWQRLLVDPDTTVAVVERTDRSGPLWGAVSVGAGRLGHLLVDPARWGAGLGAVLLETGLAHLRTEGVRRIELTCLLENHRARAFYAKHGFQRLRDDGRASWPPYPRQVALTRPV